MTDMITISIPHERLVRLKEMAVRFNITPEELVNISIFNLLREPEEVFLTATDYVLKKNAELYKRLA